MRWPWQRDTSTTPVATPPPAVVEPPAPAPVVRARADWRRVGTLRPTADPGAPTLVPTGLPVLASTRSLLHRPRTEPAGAPVGRVTGLASVPPTEAPDSTVPQAQQAPAQQAPPPAAVTVRATVAARPGRPTTLTMAIRDYVGEARVPDVPHRAPGWLRAGAPPDVVTPLDAFTSPSSTLPEVALLDSWITPHPPVIDADPVTTIDVDEQPVPARRRRPGLGLPLPAGERPPTQPTTPPMVVDMPVPAAEGAAGPALVHPTVTGRFSARVPADLAETFQREYGVEVSDVVVDRSAAGAAQARSIGARAFAHHDLIVLPEEVGPVESVGTRALLGHELAHVVQQRTIGSVPTESGSDGQRLEAAARSVEQWVRAGAVGPPPPVVPPESSAPPAASERSGREPVRRRASAGPPSGAGAPQRAVTGATDAPPVTRPHAPVVTTSTGGTPAPATPATLVHPAQPGGHPTPPADTHDPLNPRNSHEYGALVGSSFAGLGLDMFGLGGLAHHTPPPTPPATNTPRPTTTPTTPATPGVTPAPALPGAAFDRDTRRGELRDAALQRINLIRGQQGDGPVSELPETELAAIEVQLDSEQAGRPGGAQQAAPVVHNWSEMREEVRLGGGELLGSLIGYNPVDAAERERHATEARAQQETAAATTPAAPGTGPAAAAGAAPAAAPVGGRPPEPTGAELTRLYDRIHTRLLRELLVGRERSGSLMDFR